ncbi:YpoC family protein [Bacillus sp. T33-2]|uniref:YpoC family protein n=1 Tax=Bacillus sp. T33-2 TaxID=2054168 RepID=UPI000C7564D0|nr:hypothetical protein [Bacillus sp. T33-2]PLR99713.1 hypothetical protein CVD19_01245 [Bacillus sp. T33-2]
MTWQHSGLNSCLASPFFFPEGVLEWEARFSSAFTPEEPFIYEFAFFTGLSTIRPWEDPELYVPLLLEEWPDQKTEIGILFKNRNRHAAVPAMRKAIGMFIQLLYWTNSLPASPSLAGLENLGIKPANARERIEFIISSPALHHSFIQLSELFIEQQKQFAIATVRKNRPKK